MAKFWRIFRTMLFIALFVVVYAVAVIAAIDGTTEYKVGLGIFTIAAVFGLPKIIKTLASPLKSSAESKAKVRRRLIIYLVLSVLLTVAAYFMLALSPTPVEDVWMTVVGIFVGLIACFGIIELCMFYLPRVLGFDED